MLVLSRNRGQTLCIGDNVRVTFLGNKGSQVRLAIEAPPDAQVYREEIYQRIQADKRIVSGKPGS